MASGSPVPQPGRPASTGLLFQQQFTVTRSAFPSGDELIKMNSAVPNGAERAFQIVEKQSDHRMKLETWIVASNIFGERLGQVIAAAVVGVGFWVGYHLIMAGKDLQGLGAIITPVAAVAGVFLVGKKRRDKELNEKSR